MDNVIGIISANFSTPELEDLTKDRTVSALPYGSRYRLIDFTLSNMTNSGINSVGIITPYSYRSLLDHISSGEYWNLTKRNGGLFILPGVAYGPNNNQSRLVLRDIRRNLAYLKRSQAEFVLITSSDVIYNMNYQGMINQHNESGADVTLLYKLASKNMPGSTKIEFKKNRIVDLDRNAEKGDAMLIPTVVMSRKLLLKVLDWYAHVDYMDLLNFLSNNVKNLRIEGYCFNGYVHSISSISDYYQATMDLLKNDIRHELFSKENPIMTKDRDRASTRYSEDAEVSNSLIPAGCVIEGTVENSVLFRNVRVGKGAVIRNSIILQSCVIEEGASIEYAILDRRNVVTKDSVLKGTAKNLLVLAKKGD
ncbi:MULTISPECIES: glucose-1-phosphate adenylyltransferase subunit GlgD [Terrabacteria group]|uniref:glucose-1-phosphate adenylyltransferase subunit GlgD n=1 Tax=Bacillati TaxID=1783272 RepID=UPI00193ADA48|nr:MULTISPECIES: glucose-1-phosphate adenylyltransferase subunit GlgD [Terrabacteria group]MBW9211993.1 glucose-1-phosphate adenylyltransferase subunit GlgD [Trueperella sp. zg.1013]QRG87202.1 glucose-1-phosphate adenylyltransferase subunit GlgD [Bulleidia sp. zg-1006]